MSEEMQPSCQVDRKMIGSMMTSASTHHLGVLHQNFRRPT